MNDVEQFLANGGRITELARGASGIMQKNGTLNGRWGNFTLNDEADLQGLARKARYEAMAKGRTYYEGLACLWCKMTTRYTANCKCVHCEQKTVRSKRAKRT